MMGESIEARAMRWAVSDDTGASSKAIFGVMTGNPPKDGWCYPHDGGDLGRCLRLLELIPEWRARLDEMRAVGPEWSALVDHWDELAGLYAKAGRGGNVYDRMQAILRPIEKNRPGLVNLGNVSFYSKP